MYFSIWLNQYIKELKATEIIRYMISWICCLITVVRAAYYRNGEIIRSLSILNLALPSPPLACVWSVICIGTILVFQQRQTHTIAFSGKWKWLQEESQWECYSLYLQHQQRIFLSINAKHVWELCRKDYYQRTGDYKEEHRKAFNQETSICKYFSLLWVILKLWPNPSILWKIKFFPIYMGMLDPHRDGTC